MIIPHFAVFVKGVGRMRQHIVYTRPCSLSSTRT
jgi:hypothetical protein